jgi:hypothetical protein
MRDSSCIPYHASRNGFVELNFSVETLKRHRDDASRDGRSDRQGGKDSTLRGKVGDIGDGAKSGITQALDNAPVKQTVPWSLVARSVSERLAAHQLQRGSDPIDSNKVNAKPPTQLAQDADAVAIDFVRPQFECTMRHSPSISR